MKRRREEEGEKALRLRTQLARQNAAAFGKKNDGKALQRASLGKNTFPTDAKAKGNPSFKAYHKQVRDRRQLPGGHNPEPTETMWLVRFFSVILLAVGRAALTVRACVRACVCCVCVCVTHLCVCHSPVCVAAEWQDQRGGVSQAAG
jgi:hypothetical protein